MARFRSDDRIVKDEQLLGTKGQSAGAREETLRVPQEHGI